MYAIALLRRAQKELAGLPQPSYVRVRDAIRAPSNEPGPSGARKLTGRDGWRLRVGSYRVLYEIDDDNRSITVVHIGHRRDVYR